MDSKDTPIILEIPRVSKLHPRNPGQRPDKYFVIKEQRGFQPLKPLSADTLDPMLVHLPPTSVSQTLPFWHVSLFISGTITPG